MILPVFVTYTSKFYFVLERRYSSDRTIISIGSHCQPSFLLRQMGLQCVSYPFDWLMFKEQHTGPEYIADNIKHKFSKFLENLKKNDDGHVYADAYKTVLFYHCENLLEDTKTIEKMNRKISRFQDAIKNNKCSLVYIIETFSILGNEKIEAFCNNIKNLQTQLKQDDELLIIIRHDNSDDVDKYYSEIAYRQLNEMKSVKATHYFHNATVNGRWGDFKSYKKIMDAFGVKLNMRWPRLAFYKVPLNEKLFS